VEAELWAGEVFSRGGLSTA